MKGASNSLIKCSAFKTGGGYLLTIDAMKGFAALLVVLGHVVNSYYSSALHPEARQFEYLLDLIINSFHMAFFMTISGFLYQRAYFDENTNVRKAKIKYQILDLIGLYVTYSFIFGVSRIAMSNFSVNSHSITDVFLIWIRPIGPYWYLYVLIIFYLIFMSSNWHNINTILLTMLIGSLSVLSAFCPTDLFSLPDCLYYCLFFFLGILHQRFQGRVLNNMLLAILSIGIGLLLLIILETSVKGINTTYEPNRVPVTRTLIALGISSGLWIVFSRTRLGLNKLLLMVGRYSLEIYILHIYIVTGLKVILPRVGVDNGYTSIAINFIFSSSIPIIISILVRKLGIYKYFFEPIRVIRDKVNYHSKPI